MNTEKYCFMIKTVQTAVLRILIEALKELLTDANFKITKDKIKLSTMDATHTVLVYLELLGSKFEYFYFDNSQSEYVIGVNLLNLFKLIKTTGTDDILTLSMEKKNTNILIVQIDNNEKNSRTIFKINLMDLDDKQMQIPPVTFETIITIPSSNFQKICRDMFNISDTIDIKCIDKHIIFKCEGDFASQETLMGEVDTGFSYIKNSDNVVQGLFDLKYLVLFSKCTNLCGNINLYFKNDYPLILLYNVANLGNIKLALAPKFATTD